MSAGLMGGDLVTTIDEILVVMPAHDESALIGEALDALAVARSAVDCATRVVVVLDSCSDGTERIVRARRDVEAIEVEGANVGAARAAGVVAGVAASVVPVHRIWIASTDADSQVDADWLVEQLTSARGGADVVVGTIRPDPRDLSAEQHSAWHTRALEARIDADAGAGVHGANLGLRGDVDARLGGFAPLRVGEDDDLVRRARQLGLRVVASDRGQVTTSARIDGRAPHGYAEFVRTHY